MKKSAANVDAPQRSTRPAMSPETRENQLISRAVDLAEQQIINGTASSQVLTHFLKAGSAKTRMELKNLEEENKLLRAKTEHLQSEKRMEEMYKQAIAAMRRYGGQDVGVNEPAPDEYLDNEYPGNEDEY